MSYNKNFIYKTSSSQTPKPRTTQTSIKAGKLSDIIPIKKSVSASGALATVERQKKISQVEKQLEKAEVVEPSKIKIENLENLKTSDKMIKSLIAPSARDAPRFLSRRPQELRRFVRSMEDLYKDAGIVDDEEKKNLLGKYADQESEEEWSALETFEKGNSWEDFKNELMENYPEAAEAERGTPARIKQVCRETKIDTKGIKLGDLSTLFAFRRAFMAEAKKLSKPPAAMSNRELVELFIGTLSPSFATEVIQYLGNKAQIGKQTAVSGVSRRPEDRYDLEDVCKAAIQVSENSQGMFHLMNLPGEEKHSSRKESSFNQSQSETTNLVQKLESLENNQAVEKDKMVITNKNLDNRFNELENMIKNLINQVQSSGNKKDPVIQYDPNMGIKIGQPGTIPKWEPNGRGNNISRKCFYCGGIDHFIPDCEDMKNDIKTGYVTLNHEGKLRMQDGGYVPTVPNGAPIKERIEKWNMKKQNQFYCGYDDNDGIPEPMIPRYPAQFVHTTEDPTYHRARLERELDLKEREEELELRKLKLEREEKRRTEQTNKPTCSPQVLELLEQLTKEDKSGFQ